MHSLRSKIRGVAFFCLCALVKITSALSSSTPTTTGGTTVPSIKLTYFDIEGVAECVRLAMLLSGVDFEDVRVQFSEWEELKPKMRHGTLPIMTINDGPPRVQSQAMLRWIGSEFSKTLYPRDKLIDIEEAIGLFGDMQRSLGPALYMAMRPQMFGYPEGSAQTDEGQARVKALREAWVEHELPKWANYITQMITQGSGGGEGWLVTARDEGPTIADCVAVPALRSLTHGTMTYVPPDCLDAYPTLVEYIKRFCALEAIQGRYTIGVY